jgi:sec-independent protein translocase protein TatA
MGGWDAPWHWVVLAIVVIALIGYKKLPDAARSLGRSLRIFKTEIKGMSEDDKARANAREEADAERSAPEQRALPAADVIKRETDAADQRPSRPRPSPSPHGRS